MLGSSDREQALSRYLLRGLVFQPVIVGGGYCTGREVFIIPLLTIGVRRIHRHRFPANSAAMTASG